MTREDDSRKFAANMFRASEFHLKMLSEASGRFATYMEQADAAAAYGVEFRKDYDLVAYILRKVWPFWKVCRGKVPPKVLRQLDEDGDWPRGCAAAAVKRISTAKTKVLRLVVKNRTGSIARP
jgi:hypothetical protein